MFDKYDFSVAVLHHVVAAQAVAVFIEVVGALSRFGYREIRCDLGGDERINIELGLLRVLVRDEKKATFGSLFFIRLVRRA